MTSIKDLLKEALKRGIEVQVYLADDGEFGYKMMGFYKSGSIKLQMDNDIIKATSRYNIIIPIESWDDVVEMNHEWWVRSRDRFDGWSAPSTAFAEDFKRLGLR